MFSFLLMRENTYKIGLVFYTRRSVMNIAVIGGTQMAIKGTKEEIDSIIKQLLAVKVEQNGAVVKYITPEQRVRLAK